MIASLLMLHCFGDDGAEGDRGRHDLDTAPTARTGDREADTAKGRGPLIAGVHGPPVALLKSLDAARLLAMSSLDAVAGAGQLMESVASSGIGSRDCAFVELVGCAVSLGRGRVISVRVRR